MSYWQNKRRADTCILRRSWYRCGELRPRPILPNSQTATHTHKLEHGGVKSSQEEEITPLIQEESLQYQILNIRRGRSEAMGVERRTAAAILELWTVDANRRQTADVPSEMVALVLFPARLLGTVKGIGGEGGGSSKDREASVVWESDAAPRMPHPSRDVQETGHLSKHRTSLKTRDVPQNTRRPSKHETPLKRRRTD